MIINKLLLLSGNDIPFPGGQTIIHTPKIKEIALIGEKAFYLGSNFLCFSKEKLREQDKTNLKNFTDFDILMSKLNNKIDHSTELVINSAIFVLSLLFPNYDLVKMPNMIFLNKINQDGTKEQIRINNDNFNQFRDIVKSMFCLQFTNESQYNPANKKAAQIAKKLQQRKKKLQKHNENKDQEINTIYHYISILTLGNHHTIPQLMDYTVYQLFDEFQRFEKKYSYDIWLQAKMAGAQNLEDVDSWLNDEQKKVESLPKSNRIEF